MAPPIGPCMEYIHCVTFSLLFVKLGGFLVFQYDSECCFSSHIVAGTSESEQASNEISYISLGYTLFSVTDAVILITFKCFHRINRSL